MSIRVGDQAITESRLYPTGVVRIGLERLDARSAQGTIEAGVTVVILGDSADGLLVRPLHDGTPPEQLPNFGQPVFRSPLERSSAIMEKLEAAAQDEITASASAGRQWSAIVGALSLGGAAASRWSWLVDQADSPAVYVLAAGLIGAGWGVAFFELVHYVLWNLDAAHRRIALATTVVGLLSSAVAVALLVPLFGLIPGVLAGLLTAVITAALVPTGLVLLGS